MELIVKNVSNFTGVTVRHESITLDLGLLNTEERDSLAKELVTALWAMGPSSMGECETWLKRMISECGIEL